MTRGRLALVACAVLVLVVAFGAGRQLAKGSTAGSAYALDAGSYEKAPPLTGLSAGGFSGLEAGSDVARRPLIAGRVTAVANGTVSLAASAGPTTIRLTGDRALRRIEPAEPVDLKPGTNIVLRIDPAGDQAEGVLVASAP